MSTMLWRKESNRNNALLVDLFASQEKLHLGMLFTMTKMDNEKPPVGKCANASQTQRNEGNDCFKNGEFNKAIEKYNKSLCLAPPSSQLVGMAYANRSVCFLKLKMYNECLVDIKLAKQNNYPDHLVFKLDEREADCLKCIGNGEDKIYDIGLSLSYDSDETYLGVANVLNVTRDRNGNFTVTAKEDIGVGKTVVVEKAFTTYLLMGRNLRCSICLKRNTNLVPCNKCTSVMFCHDKCDNNILHDGECGLTFSGIADLDAGMFKEVRIILMIINIFPTAYELMDFVQQTIQQQPMEPTLSLDDEKLRYLNFLKLPISQADFDSEEYMTSLFFMYRLAMEIPKVKTYFHTEKHRRFLMHLLCLHSQITEKNSNWSKRTFACNGEIKNICTHGIIGLRHRFFGTSCAPNVMHTDHNDLSVFITIRPIKKDEPLLTFIADYLLLESRAIRQKAIRETLKTDCKCSRCQGICATSAQQREITSDPDYCYVSSRQEGTDNAHAMNEKFVSFLNKHGHVPWCDAIEKVVDAYLYFLRYNMYGEVFTPDIVAALNEI
ncbi:SET and MYND domain-containing protein 4 [Pseudolycoriella hygida]|uniref:SET and MYND domain-containing protein 4 n=1 Tax=Pseudolycoriella hygida TaxID=35572 RepID=A0A9Q0S4C4_9DIPT|nr:SET and MYND domain-containing protein 4 [Pseudolycoriella hygida]